MHLNLLGFSASRLLSVTAACIFPVMAQLPDTDRDGIPNSTDPFPTVNAVVADPDGNNNLSAGFQSGLIGRWDFETMAVSGTNYSFADIAGGDQPLNCRQLSMSIDNSGMISKGALFDAGNDHLAAPGTLFHNRTAFSTSMWFKIPPGYIQNKAGNIHTVFFACNGALDAYPELIVSIYKGVPGSTTQKITVSRYNGTTLTITFFGEIPVADYLDDGFWNHLAFVKNGNNSRLFVNGVKIKESNITNPTLTATTAGYISYGKNVPVATDQGHTFRGSMDRIRFYSRNLSDAEVTELYRQDSDRDGFPDIVEKDWGTTYPLSPFYWQSPEQDTDQDGLPDFWERLYGLDPLNTTGINGGTGDGDGDGVTNINEFQNSTSPGKKDTDGDGVSDAIEVSQGSDANSAADSGKPPTDPLESVTFRTGGDYATWQMNITGLGPRDFRKLQVTAPKFNDFITVTHKLRKNNSYQIKLTHTGSRPDQPDTWYCWEAQVNGFPTTASFTTSAANTLGVRTTTGLATVINNHWVVDNTSGLLTTHLHSKSINKVSSLTTYLLPVEVNCPELYMFGGHKNDVVELCKVSGITCQWKLKDLSPVIGTFDHPTDSACSFTATAPGKNIIQLLIGGNVVWEKPTEILQIKSRADWGAVAAKTHTQTMPTIQNITLHHTSNTGTGWDEMQRIQKLHMSLFPYNLFGGKDFDDIGYHLIMDKNGDVFEGRKIEGAPGMLGGPYAKGEHVGSNNTVAGFGLCTMGDYEASEGNEAWPAARQKSIEKVISAVCRRHKLTKDKISYHKAMALSSSPSSCPGSNYIPAIPDIIKHVEENLR